MAELEAFFLDLSAKSGLPADQLKYVCCLLAAIPLGWVFHLLPRSAPSIRHLFSIIVSIAFASFCLGPYSWVHALLSSGVAYLMMVLLPHGIAHRVVFVWMMAYISASHIYRMSVDWMGWSLDFTGPQMILTIKVTSAAMDYYDGACTTAEKEKMTPFQKEHRIPKLPTLLEWFGFVYFFPSFLAGPAIFIQDYLSFIDGSMFKDCKGKKPPSTIFPMLLTLGQALLVFPFVVMSTSVFPLRYLTTAAFFNAPLYERVIRLYLHVTPSRAKYYFGWYLAEGSFVTSGFSYNGVDKQGKVKWDRATNSYPLLVELAPNMRSVTDNWNAITAVWLKNYIYLRFENNQTSSIPTIVTYTCSAFWHGFYPGYYLFFLHASAMTEIAKMFRRKVRPLFMKDAETPNYPFKYLYDVAGTVVISLFLNYAGASFLLLELPPAWNLWKSVYFYGHLGTLLGYIVMRIWPSPRRSSSTRQATPAAKKSS